MHSLKHMQVLKVDSEITVLYKIIITVFFFFLLSKYTSLSTSLYFLCVLNKHHCSHCRTAPRRVPEKKVSTFLACPPPRVDPPFHPPLPHIRMSFTFCSVTWLSHVVLALQGRQVFSWVIHTIHGKTCSLHHLLFKTCMWHGEGCGGWNWGFGGNPKKCLDLTCFADPVKVSFFSLFFLFFCVLFFFVFYLTKEADRPDFEPKLLVGVPKVSQHDIDDWNLINFGSVNLHHSLSVALPRRTAV